VLATRARATLFIIDSGEVASDGEVANAASGGYDSGDGERRRRVQSVDQLQSADDLTETSLRQLSLTISAC
jgi:hypothetical protein